MWISRGIWQKVSRLSRNLFLLIIFIIGLASGQRYRSRLNDNNTFQDAVNKYNRAEYIDVKQILDNLSYSEKSFYEEDIQLLRLKTEYQLHNYDYCRAIGKAYLNKFSRGKHTDDVLTIFGDIYISEGIYEAAYRSYVNALGFENDRKSATKIESNIFTTLQYGINASVVEELLLLESNNNIINILLLSKTHINLEVGNVTQALENINQIDRRDLSSNSKNYYDQLIEKIEDNVHGTIIPVVLPLSGKNAKIGIEFLEGLKFAQSQNSNKRLNLSFIVYDNESDPIKTLEVFQKINQNSNTIAVLGPIDYDNAIIAGSVGNQIAYPILLPDIMNIELSDISENLFLMNSDLSLQGKLAANYAVNELHAENIAILAQADKNGKALVDAFENELNKYDMTASIIEWYAGIPTSLDRQFQAIRTKAWEIQDLNDTTDTNESTDIYSDLLFNDSTFINSFDFESDSVTSHNAIIDSLLELYKSEEELLTKEDSAKVELETIDVIYMPINADDLDYVGAQFPAYNLVTTIIGNDNWSDLNILRKENIGTHIKGLTIITNYEYYNINQLNDVINEKRTKYFYQAFDAYNFLIESFLELQESDLTMHYVLNNLDRFNGIFGSYEFQDGNNVNTDLKIMRFDGYRFEEVDTFNSQTE